MTTDAEIFGRVHTVNLVNGEFPPDFEVDPDRVYTVSDNANRPIGTKSYRYVFALSGDTSETRDSAVHKLHNQVLAYRTTHGIVPFYKTQEGVAAIMLNVHKKWFDVETPSGTVQVSKFSDRDQVRIDKFKAGLSGSTPLIVRGAFHSPEEFVDALTQSILTQPAVEIIRPVGPPLGPVFTLQDTFSLAAGAIELEARAIKAIGTAVKRTAANTPLESGADLAIHVSEKLQQVAVNVRDAGIGIQRALDCAR